MPCQSDYLNPTERERELQRTAKLLIYVLKQQGEKVEKGDLIHTAAKDMYCKVDLVPNLCAAIRFMSDEEKERIMYNAHSSWSRDLANWWERHDMEDRKRVEEQRRVKKVRRIAEHVLASHTDEEIAALREYFTKGK